MIATSGHCVTQVRRCIVFSFEKGSWLSDESMSCILWRGKLRTKSIACDNDALSKEGKVRRVATLEIQKILVVLEHTARHFTPQSKQNSCVVHASVMRHVMTMISSRGSNSRAGSIAARTRIDNADFPSLVKVCQSMPWDLTKNVQHKRLWTK